MYSGAKLKTSTPLQYRHDSGFGSFVKNSDTSSDKVIELSPVRKQSSLKCNFSAVLKVCRNFKWSKPVDKVSKKLLNASDIIDSDSVDHHTESGISVTSQTESLSEEIVEFPPDENSNIICSFYETSTYQPYKYICTEDQKLNEIIEKEFKCSSQEKNATLFKLLGDDISTSTDAVTGGGQNSVPKCDVLYELHLRNCSGILSDILTYLSAEELRIVSHVSKQWQDIVFSDKTANKRKETYLKNRRNTASGPNKENRFQTLPSAERDHKSAFTSVANKSEGLRSVKFASVNGRFDSFIEEMKLLKDKETLEKCPKCQYPSKSQSENKFCCMRKLCLHEFCKKCLGPYLNNHLCSVPGANDSFPNVIVGSKKSKKNLRRL